MDAVAQAREELDSASRALASYLTPLILRPRVARTGNIVTFDGTLLVRVPGRDRRERRRYARAWVATAVALAQAERDRLGERHAAADLAWERVRPPVPGIACTVLINGERYDARVADVTRCTQADILAALQAAGAPVSDVGQVQRARAQASIRLFANMLGVFGDVSLGLPGSPAVDFDFLGGTE